MCCYKKFNNLKYNSSSSSISIDAERLGKKGLRAESPAQFPSLCCPMPGLSLGSNQPLPGVSPVVGIHSMGLVWNSLWPVWLTCPGHAGLAACALLTGRGWHTERSLCATFLPILSQQSVGPAAVGTVSSVPAQQATCAGSSSELQACPLLPGSTGSCSS